VPWATLLGLILLVNAVVLGVLFWRGSPASPSAAETPATPAMSAAPAKYHPSVRPLAAEAGAADATPVQTAPLAAASPPDVSAAAAPPNALPPALDTLPQDIRQTLPSLHLDVLGYADKRAERFAVINLKHYRIGDVLAEGPTLKDVLPQGAVLEFHGSVFLLPAT
jgi:hypothetical protein